jgi:hypothetical protein
MDILINIVRKGVARIDGHPPRQAVSEITNQKSRMLAFDPQITYLIHGRTRGLTLIS